MVGSHGVRLVGKTEGFKGYIRLPKKRGGCLRGKGALGGSSHSESC